jgi:lipoprotein-anchoring transpeptidase ErfK/SrfK
VNLRLIFFAGALLLAACSQYDKRHVMHISVADQKLVVTDRGEPVATYPISTSKFGVNSREGSYGTPAGRHRVAKKIGGGLPIGAVMKSRRFTGEVLAIDAPGRDPIVTRILWLQGLETQNRNSFARNIYIHGTPEERNIGLPVSYGCIRMKSRDVVELYTRVGAGARVDIFCEPLAVRLPKLFPPTEPVVASTNQPTQIMAGQAAETPREL